MTTEHRTIAHGAGRTIASLVVVIVVVVLDVQAIVDGVAVWGLRVLAAAAAVYALLLAGIEIYQRVWGPRLVFRADPVTGRVTRHERAGGESLTGAQGFHCIVRLRGWRHRAELFHGGTRTGMSLSVVRYDPDTGEVLAYWRDGHSVESALYVRVDDLLTALAGLSNDEIRLLLSSGRSEPLAGMLFALLARRMAQYRTERDRARDELAVAEAARAGAEAQVAELAALVEALEVPAEVLPAATLGPRAASAGVSLEDVSIDEERLHERALEQERRANEEGRGVVGRVLDAASGVAGRIKRRRRDDEGPTRS